MTEKGKIHFLALKKPVRNPKNPEKAPQYSVAVELDINSEAVQLINKLSPKKVDTENNLKAIVAGTRDRNKRVINFSSQFSPKAEFITDATGKPIEAPYFDSRVDTGNVEVLFNVNTVGDKHFINLQGVRLSDLVLTDKTKVDKGLELLKSTATYEAELKDLLGK